MHSPIRLHGVVLNYLSTRTALPFTFKIIIRYLGTNLKPRYGDNDNNIEENFPATLIIQFEYTFQSNDFAICFVWMTNIASYPEGRV
jgi:hypothetical protein